MSRENIKKSVSPEIGSISAMATGMIGDRAAGQVKRNALLTMRVRVENAMHVLKDEITDQLFETGAIECPWD